MELTGLPDHLRPRLRVLLVGINPGLRSAEVGHHFAGRSNRFWQLIHEAGLTPRRFSWAEDAQLPELGIGLTNVVARPTRSSSELGPRDFERGSRELMEKVRRVRPRCVAFVGITAYRSFAAAAGKIPPGRIRCGLQEDLLEGAAVFVLPNPSGRNAHYPYPQMLRSYRALARWLKSRAATAAPAPRSPSTRRRSPASPRGARSAPGGNPSGPGGP